MTNMNYINVCGMQIVQIQKTSKSNIDNINTLVNSTANTWQAKRDDSEKLKDTKQGKIAELVLKEFFNDFEDFCFVLFDEIRSDKGLLHAPFDAILFKRSDFSNDKLSNLYNEINKEISSHNSIKDFDPVLRKKLRDNRIYTFEIKSSSLKPTDFEGVNVKKAYPINDYEKITNNIRKRDFITYPFFCRSSNQINNFSDYCRYVKNNKEIFRGMKDSEFITNLLEIENSNNSDIFTRLYFDFTEQDYDRIYLPGYILKEEFFDSPLIGKMPQNGKSEKAIYFMKSIRGGKSLNSIFSDSRLWG